MSVNTEAIINTIQNDALAFQSWSDDRRNQFCEAFHDKIRASQYIIYLVADSLLRKTLDNHMLNGRRSGDLGKFVRTISVTDDYHYKKQGSWDHVGGRSKEELAEVATGQVKEILNDLPKMVDIVQVLDKTTADRIRERDSLVAECTALRDELAETCQVVSLTTEAENNPKMTLREFVDSMKKRESRRVKIVNLLNEKLKEGARLDGEIAKSLYKGVPGLSEAVESTIRDLVDQAATLNITGRKVEEKIKFGDCEAALQILQSFEKDETQVKAQYANRIREAVQKLGLPVKEKKARAKKSTASGRTRRASK